MKVVAFIPARFGSTRLEGKPLMDIKGKPMVQHVYERVARAETLSDVTVATDDERIKRAVEAFGAKAVMTSRTCRTGTERVAEAATGVEADIVVNVQGDEPLIDPALVDDVVRPLMDDPELSLSTPATIIDSPDEFRDPNVVKVVVDTRGNALYFSRSPIPYHRHPSGGPLSTAYKHIGLYVYRKDVLLRLAAMPPTPLEEAESLEQLRALENGFRIRVVKTSYNPASVDTPEDLDRVRGML